jgi:hypothetical protein
MSTEIEHSVLRDALQFPLGDALFGRRSRRFSFGTSIPDGPLSFQSPRDVLPLTGLEQMMLLTATCGNTGWHYMITRHARYAPHISNYSAAAGGRTFPSAAGVHTSEVFFTNDEGVFFMETRDAPALLELGTDGKMDLEALVKAHRKRIRKLSDGRLHIPPEEPYMLGHNTWCANVPGSLLVIPVGDVAQHEIALLCFLVQNGYCIYDDVNREKISGLDHFRGLVDVDHPYPLTWLEQYALTEVTVELSTGCYAGMLMLQAMGLGGWMYDGIDRYTLLGTSGDPKVPGLGFRYDTDDRWALPNPTGLQGVFEGHCPPHYPNMRGAVEALARRKFGPGGPFHPDTPGPWKDTAKVRGSAQVYSEEFKECVGTMAQYVYDKFGKFPGTVPSIYTHMFLQAHHLDLDFYDFHFKPGAYLETHKRHMERWHTNRQRSCDR